MRVLIGELEMEDQVVVLCLIAMLLFLALGGAWSPLDLAGKAFSAIGRVVITAYTMDGFQNIVMRELDWMSILKPADLLMCYALASYSLALWKFKF